MTNKRFRLIRPPEGGGSNWTADLDSSYGWDDYGRLTSTTYPSQSKVMVTNTYDTMSRLNKVSIGSTDWANNAVYNFRGALTSLQLGTGNPATETRQYNVIGQMTRLTVSGSGVPTGPDIEYTYSSNQNNGRITKMKDWVSGEEVNYTYDSLNRMITASTTGAGWGNSYTYDGFGNLTAKTVAKGSAPTLSVAVDTNTNRIVGQYYDANGT